jgi:hypothetical protein
MKSQWKQVPVAAIGKSFAGWRNVDAATSMKLSASLKRFGQLRAVVVWLSAAGTYEVIDGRNVLSGLAALGADSVQVLELSEISLDEATQVALALGLEFETDYARVARACAGLLDSGVTAEHLAGASPFSAERIKHFKTLCSFDWSQFDIDEDQHEMSWSAAPDLPSDAEVHSSVFSFEVAPDQEPAREPLVHVVELDVMVETGGAAEPQLALF